MWLLPALGSLTLSATMLARTTFGRDEMATWQFARLSLPDLIDAVQQVDAVLAPYYLLMHLWTLPGDGEAWMRVPSAVAVAVAAATVARLAQRAWGPAVGLLAGSALALHPLVAGAAVEARPYALALMLCTLGTALVLDEEPLRRRRYVVVMALAVTLHLFALLVVAVHLLLARDRRSFLLAGTLVGLVAVPVALVAHSQRVQLAYVPEPTLSSALELVRAAATPGSLLWLVLLAGTLAAYGAWTGGRAERTTVAAGVLLALLPAFLLLVASLVLSPVLVGRYLFTAPLGAALVLAVAGAVLARNLWLPLVLLAALVVVVAPDLRTLHGPRINGADFPRLAEILEQRARPGDELRVVIRRSQGGMPAGVARYTGDEQFVEDVLDGLPDLEPLTYRRTYRDRAATELRAAGTPPARTVWLVGVLMTQPVVQAVADLRAEGCRARKVHHLSELTLYRFRCPA